MNATGTEKRTRRLRLWAVVAAAVLLAVLLAVWGIGFGHLSKYPPHTRITPEGVSEMQGKWLASKPPRYRMVLTYSDFIVSMEDPLIVDVIVGPKGVERCTLLNSRHRSTEQDSHMTKAVMESFLPEHIFSITLETAQDLENQSFSSRWNSRVNVEFDKQYGFIRRMVALERDEHWYSRMEVSARIEAYLFQELPPADEAATDAP